MIRDINSILENVDNAKASEVLEGDYSTLFAQYKALLSNMDESLAGLRSTLESEQNSKQRYEEELAGYSCEESEYTDPTLPVETLSRVRQERETCEKSRDSRQDEYTEKKGDYTAAEQELKHAKEALAEHEGMFDIAKHFNVQLICLSDINKSDVTSCFECVIKLVIKQQALSNFEIMTHEGNERIEHGYYKIMNGQMSLF